MVKQSLITLCLLQIVIGWTTVKAQETRPGPLHFEPYVLKTFDGREHSTDLGRLSVRENRTASAPHQIQLSFIRLHSTATHPAAPIVFLAGGPGVPASNMARVPVYFRLFDSLRGVSDVILLDQRGTGMSTPGLQCPTPSESAAPDVLTTHSRTHQQLVKGIRACADQLRTQGIDLAAYNINAVADDVDDLRQALGVEKVHLLALSFGTQLALATIRRHGEHVDRAVLAGTQGPDNNLSLPTSFDSLLKKISSLAAQDAKINKAVPDFDVLVEQVLDEFRKHPITLEVTDRRTKLPVKVIVGQVALQVLLQGLSDGRAMPSIPAFYYTISHGDYSLITLRIEGLYNSINGSGNSAMSIAMSCSGGYSSKRLARVQREAQGSLVGNTFNLQLTPDICKLMGNPDLGAAYRARISSPVPTLFLSGTLDGVTPPFQAEEMRKGFPNGVHLIVENASHETLPYSQVQTIVVDFFRGQDVSGRVISLPRPEFVSVEDAKKQ